MNFKGLRAKYCDLDDKIAIVNENDKLLCYVTDTDSATNLIRGINKLSDLQNTATELVELVTEYLGKDSLTTQAKHEEKDVSASSFLSRYTSPEFFLSIDKVGRGYLLNRIVMVGDVVFDINKGMYLLVNYVGIDRIELTYIFSINDLEKEVIVHGICLKELTDNYIPCYNINQLIEIIEDLTKSILHYSYYADKHYIHNSNCYFLGSGNTFLKALQESLLNVIN